MFEFLGPLIGAGASLLGGSLNRDSAEKTAAQNIANQRDFAQHGISWKVADARSAGINPLAALGASTNTFSNVVGSDAMGEGVAQAGQDVGKAFRAAGDHESRQLSLAGAKLDIEGKQLDNDIKRAELASKVSREATQAPAVPTATEFSPWAPIPGQNTVKPGFNDVWGQKQTPLDLGGNLIWPHKRWSDSNTVQNALGDTLQDVVAPFALDDMMASSMGVRLPRFMYDWANRGSSEMTDFMRRWGPMDIYRWLRSQPGMSTGRKFL